MNVYKHTLNLPKTAFPMKANLPVREPKLLDQWNSQGLYQQLRQQAKAQKRKPFVLHDGPPYANGPIHLGHAVNKTLKDIINKFHWLSGYDVVYVPGWDCHGLPIELNVEKKRGKVGPTCTVADFRAACRAYALSQIQDQSLGFQRLGVLADWAHPYRTMDWSYEANTLRALAKIMDNGHLQRGYKPVHWCVSCASALAEAEVEYADKLSPAIDVSFCLKDHQALSAAFTMTPMVDSDISVIVPIWTTTPWTLLANEAVTVHPELTYTLVQHGHQALIIAQDLLADTTARLSMTHVQVLGTCLGKSLAGLLVQHPIDDRQVPIILGDHVTTDVGTGCVHTAPAHGLEDYLVGKQYGLPLNNPVNDQGCFVAKTPWVAGACVFKANETIIDNLQKKGKLLHNGSIKHSYPHCWRHKTPLIFRATAQWFISMDQGHLRDQALQAIHTTKWLPDWGKERMEAMIQQRPDWCISRQRSWGTPLTLFLHKTTHEMHPESAALMRRIAKEVEHKGLEVWDEIQPSDFLGQEGTQYEKVTDTLDVWFDSGISHLAVLQTHDGLHVPAHLYLEGSDQYRGWFQSSLITAVAMGGGAPYQVCLTHGFTVDTHGHKMSKSRGNVIAPDSVVKKWGADVLRLWVASTNTRHEMTLSDEILERTAEVYRRLRNTARFLLANLFDFDPNQHQVPCDQLLSLDQWLVGYAKQVQDQAIKNYGQYQSHLVTRHIQHMCSVDLGGFYLDVIKDRQYTMPENSLGRRSAQTAMYHLLEVLVRILAPILTFTAEEIWQHMPGVRAPSVLLNTWYSVPEPASDTMGPDFWSQVMAVRGAVNKALEQKRNQGLIGSSLDAVVYLYCDSNLFHQLCLLGAELRFVLITSEATVLLAQEQPHTSDWIHTDVPGLQLAMHLSTHKKCHRCWHKTACTGTQAAHPDLCARCVANIEGPGEQRVHA